jgi:hypothetical protein
MSQTPDPSHVTVHYFVDEAGTPTLFGKRRQVIVGQEGCSNYFFLGKVDVDDPAVLGQDLEELRKTLLADPYFKNVPSMRLEQQKTAVIFHAKDDRPEIRYEVFKLLRRHAIAFYAVVRDKQRVVAEVHARNRKEPSYWYSENELYDTLVTHLFANRFYKADLFHICFAKRGNKSRTSALHAALENARRNYENAFGYAPKARVEITPSTPKETVCLQVVDYFLWALQRIYESGEDQYLDVIWPKTALVYDMDDRRAFSYGVYYNQNNPLTLEEVRAKKVRGYRAD